MKVVRRRDDGDAPAAAAAPAKPAAGGATVAPKVLVRAAAAPKLSKEEEDSQKVAQLLGKLSLDGVEGGADVKAAVAANGFAALQVRARTPAPPGSQTRLAAHPRCTALERPPMPGPHLHTPPLHIPFERPSQKAGGLVDRLKASIEGPDADAREAALLAVAQLPAAAGRAAEPYLLPLVPALLERACDKSGPARDAAVAAAVAVARSLCPHAAEMVLPVLFAHTDAAKKWQTREAALRMLAAVAEAAPRQVAAQLPAIVPLVATLMVDPREQVKAAAIDAGTASYHLVGNRDIEHLVSADSGPYSWGSKMVCQPHRTPRAACRTMRSRELSQPARGAITITSRWTTCCTVWHAPRRCLTW